MSPKVEKILEICSRQDIEIVSFGLAPNPWGFCFEIGEDTSEKAVQKINDLLNSLNEKEESELKKWIF